MQTLWKLRRQLHTSYRTTGKSFHSCLCDPSIVTHRGSRTGAPWLSVVTQEEEEKGRRLPCRTRTWRWVHCRIHRFFCPGGSAGVCSELPLHPSFWKTPRCFVPTLPTVEENQYHHGRALESRKFNVSFYRSGMHSHRAGACCPRSPEIQRLCHP